MEVIFPKVTTQKSSRSQMNIRKGKNVVWWTPLESFNGVPPNPIESNRVHQNHQNYWSLSGKHNTQTNAGCMKYAWFLQPWDKKLNSSVDDMEYTSFFKYEWLQILLLRGLLGSGTDNYQHRTPYKPLVHLHYLRPPTFPWAKKCSRQNPKNRGLLACQKWPTSSKPFQLTLFSLWYFPMIGQFFPSVLEVVPVHSGPVNK